MNRWVIPTSGVTSLALLCALYAPYGAREVEADLTARTAAAMQASGIELAADSLRFEGQEAILTGARGSRLLEEGRPLALTIFGVQSVRVVVIGESDVPAVSAAAPPATSNAPAPRPSAAADPKKLEAELADFNTRNVRFLPNSDVLHQDGKNILDGVARVIAANPGPPVEISAHTDADGDARRNMSLSRRRAASVKRYLATKGVEASRLKDSGFGSTKPLVPEETPEAKERNRRIEFHAAGAAQ